MDSERKKSGGKIYFIATFAIIMIFLVLLFSIARAGIFGEVALEKHIYFEIVMLLLLAVLAEVAVLYLRQQSTMVLMVLGIFMSASFMNIIWPVVISLGLPFELPKTAPELIKGRETITVFAQLGAVILLFKVGLHSRIEKIFSGANFLVASAGVAFPFVAGYLYASLTGGNFTYSMFLGAALTATSVGITVGILKEMRLVGKRFAEIIIGAAVIDDILGLVVLSIVINLGSAQGNALLSVATTAVTAVVFIAGALLTGKYFVKYFDSRELNDRRLLLALSFMLFFAYVAEVIQLSAIVGAFLAGIILNRSRHYLAIEEKTYGLELLFTPIFFISLGMLVDVNALFAFFIPIVIITAIAIVTKVLGCGFAALEAKLNTKESLIVGFGMSPRGEVALIIASIGLSTAAISQQQYSIISAMALLTGLATAPILGYLLKKT